MKSKFHSIRSGLQRNPKSLLVVILIGLTPLSLRAFTDTWIAAQWTDTYKYSKIGYGNYYNSNYAPTGSLAVGHYNVIPGSQGGTLAVGKNLVVNDPFSVVIGTWNKDTGGDEVFVIGNGQAPGGPDSTGPANVLEVLKNGTIRIARQGDINMGPYQ